MLRLKDLKEDGLMRQIAAQIKTDASVIAGIGDDAAVLAFTKDKYLLFKTDCVVEGTHFKKETPAFLVGRKALARNLSDIAAMGGIPRHAVITLGISADKPVDYALGIFQGINDLAGQFKVNLVGGETSRARPTFISIALLGEVEKKYLTLRSTAKAGDLIFTSAALGNSFKSEKHLKFIPRIEAARFLVKNFKPSAMLDISDGLIKDLKRLLYKSDKGAVLFEELILLSKGASLKSALYEGEDYELLFTLDADKAAALVRKLKAEKKFSFNCIGQIASRQCGLILYDRKLRPLRIKEAGFEHFR
ncbi:MAG: thiamine-phosphate kinase [Candidatus Omnitrophota bacterium]